MYQLIARLRGFQQAYDYDMALLVVWHSARRIHFTGPDAWKLAARS